jgi:low temperature requirement protein LtrA
MTSPIAYRLARMTGRDPQQSHRAATPLELLFDLAFVLAIGQASGSLAHLIAEAHIAAALAGFAFAMSSICWAWINFTWFASAYDTDDWFYRLATMVQMIGVIVLALGVPALFESIDHGEHIDNRVLVIGYVVMRIALVAQWLRAARQDPERRATALGYVKWVSLAQIGWLVVGFSSLDFWWTVALGVLLFVLEMLGPVLAERKSSGTPWHPHHIAERYGLLTIITLGEGIFGTVAGVSAIVQDQGWSLEAVLVIVAGVGLTFGLWWTYFIVNAGDALAGNRRRSWGFGYGHILVFMSVAATGAGLHVAAYVIEGHSELGTVGAVIAVAIPVVVFCAVSFALYIFLTRFVDLFHLWLLAGAVGVVLIAIALAVMGASIGWCLVVLMLSPAVVVVGYETVGQRHAQERMARESARARS